MCRSIHIPELRILGIKKARQKLTSAIQFIPLYSNGKNKYEIVPDL